jgi:hypothetical protein
MDIDSGLLNLFGTVVWDVCGLGMAGVVAASDKVFQMAVFGKLNWDCAFRSHNI